MSKNKLPVVSRFLFPFQLPLFCCYFIEVKNEQDFFFFSFPQKKLSKKPNLETKVIYVILWGLGNSHLEIALAKKKKKINNKNKTKKKKKPQKHRLFND